jgi:hypothetical protein
MVSQFFEKIRNIGGVEESVINGVPRRKERKVWLQAKVWKIRRAVEKVDKESYMLCLCNKDVKHTLLNCLETGTWQIQCVFWVKTFIYE